jgi:toxin ParE1/3/4
LEKQKGAPRNFVNTPRLTPQADCDIDEHTRYLAEKDPKVADRFLNALQTDFQNLCLHPELGNERYHNVLPEIAPVRFWPVSNGFSNWLIFYISSEKGLLVIRIIHGARNIPAIFQDEKPTRI